MSRLWGIKRIDLPLSKEEPIIILKVDLIGKLGEYKIDMALDTGATYVMISWSVAERLGYDPVASPRRVSMTTATTTMRSPLITLEAVGIGNMIVKNVETAVHDLPPKSRVDGLLGLSFLKNFDVNMKFKKGLLVIE